MSAQHKKTRILFAALLSCIVPTTVLAGPPFETDDPTPLDIHNGEFYVASAHTKEAGSWSGTAPEIELNYSPINNLMLHLIVPLAYDAPSGGDSNYGYGDTELGFKYTFNEETDRLPQVGIFPLMEVPTGREADGLGGGRVQAFLPLWLQKSFGEWTVYGGGGYGINPGEGNRNWGFGGVVMQRQVVENVLLGTEIYHSTAEESGGPDNTAFNIGSVIDLTDYHHLLFSAGSSIDGPVDFQCYFAYQFTFGPEFFQSFAHGQGR